MLSGTRPFAIADGLEDSKHPCRDHGPEDQVGTLRLRRSSASLHSSCAQGDKS